MDRYKENYAGISSPVFGGRGSCVSFLISRTRRQCELAARGEVKNLKFDPGGEA